MDPRAVLSIFDTLVGLRQMGMVNHIAIINYLFGVIVTAVKGLSFIVIVVDHS